MQRHTGERQSIRGSQPRGPSATRAPAATAETGSCGAVVIARQATRKRGLQDVLWAQPRTASSARKLGEIVRPTVNLVVKNIRRRHARSDDVHCWRFRRSDHGSPPSAARKGPSKVGRAHDVGPGEGLTDREVCGGRGIAIATGRCGWAALGLQRLDPEDRGHGSRQGDDEVRRRVVRKRVPGG